MPKRTPVVFDIDWNACIKCAACIAVCPQDAGFVSAFDTIAVDEPCNIACMACEEICPVTAISHEEVARRKKYAPRVGAPGAGG
ncbi:MAG: 4Fe-4S binding protein [Calditrichaceae bacterium]|nr:4Fe-4S binding protein [Calditrichia bacterium]NUQ40992.1 4Fe-4S binding protein [Calditrichaceae bacterium]